MNAFQYGFYDELQTLATVEDGTLATRGRLVKYEHDSDYNTRPGVADSKDPAIRRKSGKIWKAELGAQDAGLAGAALGVGLGAPIGIAAAHAAGAPPVDAVAFGGLPGVIGSSVGGAALGHYGHKALHRLREGARILRANTYVRNRAAREAQGFGNKVRAFINPGRAQQPAPQQPQQPAPQKV